MTIEDGSCARFSGLARYFGEMDSEDDLRRAEELVAEGRRIVQQQRGRIIRLKAAGVDTWDAQRALHLCEANLRRFEEHRDVLKDKSYDPRRSRAGGSGGSRLHQACSARASSPRR